MGIGMAAGCGKLEFDETSLTMRIVAGVSTIDLEICGPVADYWVTTQRLTGEWTPETIREQISELKLKHAGETLHHGNCTALTLPIGEEAVPIYAYAATQSGDEVAEATATMAPTWSAESTPRHLLPVWVHRPEASYRDPDAALPVLVFLHGLGHAQDEGDDLTFDTLPVNSGFLELFNERPNDPVLRHPDLAALPFLIVAPRCKDADLFAGEYLNCVGWRSVDRLYDELMTWLPGRFPVDARRIYVTGLSSGGEGAFRLASERPAEIAAAVPIATTYAAGSWTGPQLCAASAVPVWAFHSSLDLSSATKYEHSQAFVKALTECGAPETPALSIGAWMYANTGHGGWTEAYGNAHHTMNGAFSSIYDWLLAHER